MRWTLWSGLVCLWASPYHFDIGPGQLADQLAEWARQAPYSFLMDTNQVRGIATGGVRGDMEPPTALKHLLEGTEDLTFEPIAPGILAVVSRGLTARDKVHQVYRINIPAGPATETLNQLSKHSKVDILWAYPEAFCWWTPAIAGELSVLSAVRQMLEEYAVEILIINNRMLYVGPEVKYDPMVHAGPFMHEIGIPKPLWCEPPRPLPEVQVRPHVRPSVHRAPALRRSRELYSKDSKDRLPQAAIESAPAQVCTCAEPPSLLLSLFPDHTDAYKQWCYVNGDRAKLHWEPQCRTPGSVLPLRDFGTSTRKIQGGHS
jgi:hypothetical protein